MLPEVLVNSRKRRCRIRGGNCVADFSNPCAQCPNGHWGPMLCAGLKDPPIIKSIEKPDIKTMAKSITESSKKWISSGLKITDKEILEKRINECHNCEFWNASGFNGTGRCMKCGCSTWAKLRMATEKCPIGKW